MDICAQARFPLMQAYIIRTIQHEMKAGDFRTQVKFSSSMFIDVAKHEAKQIKSEALSYDVVKTV